MAYTGTLKFRKENDLCLRCGQPKDNKGVHCSDCSKKQREKQLKLIENNLCITCSKDKEDNNTQKCEVCRKKAKKANVISNRHRYKKWKSLGLCTKCGKITTDHDYSCNKCYNACMKSKVKTVKRLIKEKICITCYKNSACDDCQRCVVCRERYKQKRVQNKLLVFGHYGNKCQCCGEFRSGFLTIDHINNDGNIQRKKLKISGQRFYSWIIKNNYPKDLQLLCWNCNCGRYYNNGVCPHKYTSSMKFPRLLEG